MCSTSASTDENGENRIARTPSSSAQINDSKDGDAYRESMNYKTQQNEPENEEEEQNQNREEPKHPDNMLATASWWSRFVFLWPFPLLKLGMERPLVETDIPNILDVDSSRYNREYLATLWKREQERCLALQKNKKTKFEKPSLHRAILVDFFRSIWYIQPIMALAAAAKIIQAVFLGNLIESFESGTEFGYIYAGVIVACGLVVLFEHRK